jgi:hypothetical protein
MIFSFGVTMPDSIAIDTFRPDKNGVVIDLHKGSDDVFFLIRIGDNLATGENYQKELIEKVTTLVSDEIRRKISEQLTQLQPKEK